MTEDNATKVFPYDKTIWEYYMNKTLWACDSLSLEEIYNLFVTVL
jgi:hypothetical protein